MAKAKASFLPSLYRTLGGVQVENLISGILLLLQTGVLLLRIMYKVLQGLDVEPLQTL